MVLSTVKHRRAAVFAILSVLLLFVAPLVSTTLYLVNHHTSKNHAVHECTMSMETGMNMDHVQAPANPLASQGMSEAGTLCGYCDLLIHMPFFLWVAVVLLWLLTRLTRLTPILLDYGILCPPFFSAHRSRAPPKLL